jgi:hypothetical protein
MMANKSHLAILLFSAFIHASQTCHADWVPYDDFNDGIRDNQKWHYAYWQGGKAPYESKGKLILSVGGGTGSVRLPLEVELKQAGIDSSEEKNHSLIGIKDPEITGVRLDIALSKSAPLESVIFLGILERAGPKKISHAGITLGNWDDGVGLDFEKELWEKGDSLVQKSKFLAAKLGEPYRVTMLRDAGMIKVFNDTTLVDTYPSAGKQIGYFIAAKNNEGLPMSATVDNVQVYYPDSAPGRITSDLSKLSLNRGKPIPPYTVRANFMAKNFSTLKLPDGLKLNTNGVISGTPTKAGTYKVTITAKKMKGGKAVKTAKATKVFEIK